MPHAGEGGASGENLIHFETQGPPAALLCVHVADFSQVKSVRGVNLDQRAGRHGRVDGEPQATTRELHGHSIQASARPIQQGHHGRSPGWETRLAASIHAPPIDTYGNGNYGSRGKLNRRPGASWPGASART